MGSSSHFSNRRGVVAKGPLMNPCRRAEGCSLGKWPTVPKRKRLRRIGIDASWDRVSFQ